MRFIIRHSQENAFRLLSHPNIQQVVKLTMSIVKTTIRQATKPLLSLSLSSPQPELKVFRMFFSLPEQLTRNIHFQQLIKYFCGNTCSLSVYLQNLEVIHRHRNERLNVKVDQRRISISRGNDQLIWKLIITTRSDQLT